jgi:hypothetical protein
MPFSTLFQYQFVSLLICEFESRSWQGQVYSIQHYVINFSVTNWLAAGQWFSPVFWKQRTSGLLWVWLKMNVSEGVMVFNAIFNTISVITWQSVLLVEKTGENHWPAASQLVTEKFIFLSTCTIFYQKPLGFVITSTIKQNKKPCVSAITLVTLIFCANMSFYCHFFLTNMVNNNFYKILQDNLRNRFANVLRPVSA